MIVLRIFKHLEVVCVGVFGFLQGDVLQAIKKFEGRRYSKTHKCWYIPYNEVDVDSIKKTLTCYDELRVEVACELPATFQPDKLFSDLVPSIYTETLVKLRYSNSTKINTQRNSGFFLNSLPRSV
jgi:hypothetical protein